MTNISDKRAFKFALDIASLLCVAMSTFWLMRDLAAYVETGSFWKWFMMFIDAYAAYLWIKIFCQNQ